LKDISFEIQRGEVVGIIGRNGAGKSTLLKILSRVVEPTAGQAWLQGRVASLLEVGTGFHPDLTGRENVYLNGTILGMKKREIDRKFDEIAAFSGVDSFLDTPVKRYSSGMRVRLAFAVAAHLDPEILIVDEVLAVGDAAFQRKCLGKMRQVAGQGRTVMFVSHNMGALTNLCPKAICLEGGLLVDSGDSASVVSRYLERVGGEIPDGGYADLQEVSRPESLSNRQAQFAWVRTLNKDGKESDSFLEGEAITVEVGFDLNKSVSDVQLGCGIRHRETSADLFTIPSLEFRGPFSPGRYSSRLVMTPCHLREGAYGVILKMFADGTRQDTIADILRFSVIACHASEETSARSLKWVSGALRFEYQWAPPMLATEPVIHSEPVPSL
jgi:lipopolysaccharide transport system ATP-binding protein